MIDSLKVENGKYEIILEDNYEVNIYRGGELWVEQAQAPKMLIALIYEVKSLKDQLKSFGQSSSDLKTKFIGEFSWEEEETYFDEDGRVMYGEDGDPVYRKVNRIVPWTLLKQIFKEMSEYVRNRKDEEFRP